MSFAYLASTPGLKYNYSYYAIPAGWVISMAPLWWAIAAVNKASPRCYNNAAPKKEPGESWRTLKGVPADLKTKAQKAVAAGNNNHTNLPLFGAALVAANAAHVDSTTLHTLSVGYLLSRVAYNFLYVLVDDPRMSYFRSAAYFGGVASCLGLFVRAAQRLHSMPW